jgi:hypothetical protein
LRIVQHDGDEKGESRGRKKREREEREGRGIG